MARFAVLMILIASSCARVGFDPPEARGLDSSSSDAPSSDAMVKDAPSTEGRSTDALADHDGASCFAHGPAGYLVESRFQPLEQLFADLPAFETWSHICLEAPFSPA